METAHGDRGHERRIPKFSGKARELWQILTAFGAGGILRVDECDVAPALRERFSCLVKLGHASRVSAFRASTR